MFIYTGYTPQYDSNIPLQNVSVDASLVDTFGEITIRQTYKNNYSKDIEAIYCFNLTSDSSVTRMVLVINGKRMISDIREKTEARRVYTDAKSEHKTTCLLEYNDDGSYKVSLGNIRTMQEIIVELTYVTTLEYSSGFTKFVLPTNIAEKYNGSSHKTIKDLSNVTQSSYSSKANYIFNFKLNYKSHNTINGVKSQTNEIQVVPISTNEVNVISTSMPSNGDFNLLIDTVIAPGLYFNTQGDTTYIAVTHKIPDQMLDLMTVQKEFIFVVDRSGSMGERMSQWSGSGWFGSGGSKSKITLAKDALKIFINSLPPKSTFNIYSFGNTFKSMFQSSVPITNDTTKYAFDEVQKFESDMGGTEIFKCLQSILSNEAPVSNEKSPLDFSKRTWKPNDVSECKKTEPSNSSTPCAVEKVLIVLTDGQVSNSDAVIGLCEQYNYLSRTFWIGIGSDVDRNLVINASSASNGYSDILTDNDDISSSVVKILEASLKSYYKFVGATIDKHRTTEHVLYPNQSLSFFKVISTEAFNKINDIDVSGINGFTGEIETWNLPFTTKIESPSYLRQLWAHDRIKSYLQDNNRNKYANQIIKLSIEHSLATSYTSFVVVDEAIHSDKQTENVTVNIGKYESNMVDQCERSSIANLNTQRCFGARSNYDSSNGNEGCYYDSSTEKRGSINETFGNILDSAINNVNNNPNILIKQAHTFGNKTKKSSIMSGLPNLFKWGVPVSSPASTSETTSSISETASETPVPFGISTREIIPDNLPNSDGFKFGKLSGLEKSPKNVEYLLNFKNIDGSFRYDEKVLKTIGVSLEKFNTVIKSQAIPKEYLLNVLILAYIKSVNDSKFTMVQKMLESWLTANKIGEMSEIITQDLMQ